MKKKRILPVVIAVVLMALIIVGVVGVKLYEKYSYSKETMDLSRYYGIEKEGQIPIILADVVAEEKAAKLKKGKKRIMCIWEHHLYFSEAKAEK